MFHGQTVRGNETSSSDRAPGIPYQRRLEQLSEQSVTKHYDAFRDIPWENPDYQVDPCDPRWVLTPLEPLASTTWYRTQPKEIQARIGLHHYATLMKIGIEFENVLERGLLEFALRLPLEAPEFRYVYHEVIEESQHSLMFHEFIRRTGLTVRGMPALLLIGSRHVVRLSYRFPELFFFFVLGGEEPIDYVQRGLLQGSYPVHPLLRRIMQIHVTEEARHVCFAREFLRRNVPRLPRNRRRLLALRLPLLLSQMARLMLQPSRELVALYQIPRETIREAYHNSEQQRRRLAASVRKIRELCEQLELLSPTTLWLWKQTGLLEQALP
ncbi:hypothetical protein HRbin30_00268 [bacterium HR30]|nr:hypothetical protein HRbin30_00268 [bacterium HR30]